MLASSAASGQSPQITVLTGSTIHCDSSDSEGTPETFAWFVTPPNGAKSAVPDSRKPTIDVTVNTPGKWTIELIVGYAHEVDGTPWTSRTTGTIEASSVVAALDPGPPLVTNEDTITLSGEDSQVSPLATASAVFLADGTTIAGCTFPGPITDTSILNCSFPASDLGVGIHTVSLVLTDGVTGSTDTDEATIEIEEVVPFSVDFEWTPGGSNPLTLTLELFPGNGWDYGDLSSTLWNYGDGSPPESVTCSSFNYYCRYWSHTFPDDGYFDVTVTATTTTGETASTTHEVAAGNPPPLPTAAFTASPNPVSVNVSVQFTFTGNCLDSCTYLWDFGDGSTSTLLNPAHTYVEPGDRTATLTVTNSTGDDTASDMISVSNCWTPAGTITQNGACYGAPVTLSAPAADAYSWSTGQTAGTVSVAAPTLYWVHVMQGTGCWAYLEHTVSLDQCRGTPDGNVDMDASGRVDAADLRALVRELSDGDGDLVVDSWAGDLGAPGADLTDPSGGEPDGRITDDDLNRLLSILFPETTTR